VDPAALATFVLRSSKFISILNQGEKRVSPKFEATKTNLDRRQRCYSPRLDSTWWSFGFRSYHALGNWTNLFSALVEQECWLMSPLELEISTELTPLGLPKLLASFCQSRGYKLGRFYETPLS
jgi:hypothetical protein